MNVSLSPSICHILLLCSKFEMIWVNAHSIVTGMHYDHAFWNSMPLAFFPSESMCSNVFSFHKNMTISMTIWSTPRADTVLGHFFTP